MVGVIDIRKNMHRQLRSLAHMRHFGLNRRAHTHVFRSPSRSASNLRQQINNDPVRYQSVRFKKPRFFSLRRFGTFVIYSGVVFGYCYLFLNYLDIEIEVVEGDEDDNDAQESSSGAAGDSSTEEEEPYFADEDSIFIPLTWAVELPRSFYRGSDPEWQEFLKIARDKQRHKKIQEELVQLVFTGSVQHPQIHRQLGKDISVGKYWLDVSFPDGPPQEYQRSGIEIGDGFVAWSQQKVSQEDQWRVVRALWPSAAAGGAWAAATTLFGIQYRRVKQMLGWESADPFSPEERYRILMEAMQKQRQQRQQNGTRNNPGISEPTSNTDGANTARVGTQNSAETQKRLPWHIPVTLPGRSTSDTGSGISADVPIAMHVFNHNLRKSWNPKKTEPPRGSFIVQGLVEVRGSRGRMLLDVHSAYDPKQAKYVLVTVTVRNFKRWNQAPKGGP